MYDCGWMWKMLYFTEKKSIFFFCIGTVTFDFHEHLHDQSIKPRKMLNSKNNTNCVKLLRKG